MAMTTEKMNQLHELLIELASSINSEYKDSYDCPGQVVQIKSSTAGLGHYGLDKFFNDFRTSYDIELGLYFESMLDQPNELMTCICRFVNNIYKQPVCFVKDGKIVRK